MTKEYYIVYANEDASLLVGTDNGFGVFWADQGMDVLMKIVMNHPDELTKVKIKTCKNETLTVQEFLEDSLKELQIRIR